MASADTTCIIYLCSTHSKDLLMAFKISSVLCQKKIEYEYAGLTIMFKEIHKKGMFEKSRTKCSPYFILQYYLYLHIVQRLFFINCTRIYGIYHLIHDFYALICAALYCLFVFFVYIMC